MSLSQDVTYAARLLRRSPVFTLTAVLSLAIAIGANAAIFSLADAVLFRPRAGIADPDRLVDVGRSTRGEGFNNMAYLNYADLRDRNRVFSGLAAFRMGAEPMGLSTGDGAERVYGQAVSANYFRVLGVPLAIGRAFLDEEDRPGAAQQLGVLSYAFWQRRFEARRDIIGQTVRLNGRVFTIVGVAAEGFSGSTISAADLWIPLTSYPATIGREAESLTSRSNVWMIAVGRLKPGVSLDEARAQMTLLARDLEREHPRENEGRSVALVSSHRLSGFLRSTVTAFVGLLFALVGLILLVACTNVAGLMLGRALARSREVAVRIAVGAARGRIIRQLVTESLLLACIGAGGGVLLAVWLIGALRGLLPLLPVALVVDLRFDWRVVGFSTLLALVTGLLFGLAPAWQAASTDLMTALKPDAASGGRRLRLRQAFVVAQMALSVLLVVCGVLLARSLSHAASIDPGFDVRNVDVAAFDLRLAGYTAGTGPHAADEMLSRAGELPGVRSTALAAILPLIGGSLSLGPLTRPGQPADAPDRIRPDWNIVTPRYFETMRVALVRGRAFTSGDREHATPVAIVNETFAQRAWPGEDAIGKTLEHHDNRKRTLHVVGVARDGKYRSLGEAPQAFIWVPLAQNYRAELSLLARTDGTRSLTGDLRTIVRQLDPNLPLIFSSTLAAQTAIVLLPHRLADALAGTLGLVGLLLAAIGVYGITSYNAAQRTREIGVRIALGAARADVLRLIVGQAMLMSATGAAIGLLLAAAATRLLAVLLYGVRPLDPVSFGAGSVLFGALALLASFLPARRAAAVNPVEALRNE